MTCGLMCRDCPDCDCDCDEGCTMDCHEITAAARLVEAYSFGCEDCKYQMTGRAPVSAELARRQHERCRLRGHETAGGPVAR